MGWLRGCLLSTWSRCWGTDTTSGLPVPIAGGTPGALLGMRVFRHKTAKESFQLKFWLVVLVQLAVVAGFYWLISRQR